MGGAAVAGGAGLAHVPGVCNLGGGAQVRACKGLACGRPDARAVAAALCPTPNLTSIQHISPWYCRYCEDQLLEVAVRYGLCQPPSARLSLEDMLASHLAKARRRWGWEGVHIGAGQLLGGSSEGFAATALPLLTCCCFPPSLPSSRLQLPLLGGMDPSTVAAALRRYMAVVSLAAGQLLWRVDDPADCMFIIEKGAVRVGVRVWVGRGREGHDAPRGCCEGWRRPPTGLLTYPASLRPRLCQVDEFVHAAACGSSDGASAASAVSLLERHGSVSRVLARSYELGPGCVVGSTDFYLARPHGSRAVCRSPVARVLRFSRASMERMAAEVPQVGGARRAEHGCTAG